MLNWVHTQSCAYIESLTMSATQVDYAIEIELTKNGSTILSIEPESITYLINSHQALKSYCDEILRVALERI